MSTTIVSVIVLLLSQILPAIGVDLGPDHIERAIQTIVAITVGFWVWYRRADKGDVNALGFFRK